MESGYPQVLFCYEQFDELTLLHLREFDKKKLISVETDIVVDHYKEEKFENSSPGQLLTSLQHVGPLQPAHGFTQPMKEAAWKLFMENIR